MSLPFLSLVHSSNSSQGAQKKNPRRLSNTGFTLEHKSQGLIHIVVQDNASTQQSQSRQGKTLSERDGYTQEELSYPRASTWMKRMMDEQDVPLQNMNPNEDVMHEWNWHTVMDVFLSHEVRTWHSKLGALPNSNFPILFSFHAITTSTTFWQK